MPHRNLDLLGIVVNALLLGKLEIPPSFVRNPHPRQVNGSLWSIQIEFKCYLGPTALAMAGLLRRRIVVLGIFSADAGDLRGPGVRTEQH